MAGTLTVTIISRQVDDARRSRHVKLTVGAADYDNPGGFTLAPADFELTSIDGVVMHGHDTTGTYFAVYVESSGKLTVFEGLGDECDDNESGLNGKVFYATVFGDQANLG